MEPCVPCRLCESYSSSSTVSEASGVWSKVVGEMSEIWFGADEVPSGYSGFPSREALSAPAGKKTYKH